MKNLYSTPTLTNCKNTGTRNSFKLKTQWLVMIIAFFGLMAGNMSQANACGGSGGCSYHLTSPGSIGADESKCISFDPALIYNVTSPSGGSGTLVYIWQKSTDGGTTWTTISGATSSTYDPSTITVTTKYRRGAKRSTCDSYLYSNIVIKSITSGITASCSSNAGTCTNGNVGSATVTPSGGSGYTYLWNTGATTQTISNLGAGTYSVTVTASGGCTATCSTTISCTPCCNVTDGGTIGYNESKCGPYDPANIVSLTLPSGGSGTIEYVWYKQVNGGSWELISGATGISYDPPTITQTTTYKRKARRVNCTDYIYSNFITKTVTTGITASCSSSVGTCTNGNVGSATVTASGGSGYTYLWNTGATTQTISNVGAGTYSVTVTSSGGCTATCSTSITCVPCCNVTDGGQIGYNESNCGSYNPAAISSISLPSGGSGTIEYVWYMQVGSGSWTLISGATGTTYDPSTITQTTSYKRKAKRVNCTDYVESNVVVKTVQAGITATCSSNPGTCTNGNIGSATITPSGGSNYTYLWNNGATTQTISNLTAGTYSVTVTAGGCTATCSTTISCTPCCNVTDGGTIGYDETYCNSFDPSLITNVTSPSGGSGTLEYAWYKKVGSGNWELISGATSSNYDPSSITQTTSYKRKAKRANCTDYFESNVVVKTVQSGITASCVPTNGTCINGNLGSATVNVSGGSGYTFLWNTGATTQTITGLAAGTYSVGVSSGGCNASCSVTISTTPCCNVTDPGQIGYDEEKCGSFDPQAIVSITPPTGGLGTLEIVWITRTWNGTIWSDWAMIPGATSLTYDPSTISVSTQFRRCARRNGCTEYIGESNIITKTVNLAPALSCNMTNVSSYGASNGTAAVTITGGTGPFTYLWNTGATTATLNNVPAGVYSVTVTGQGGCSAFIECSITQPPYDCTGFRTQTMGGWGQCQQNGGNPGTYLFAHFATAFPSGLTVGCTNQLKLTSAQAVCDFLPSGSTPSALPSGTLTNPGGAYNNVFAGQVVALTVSLGFDQADASFGSSPALLKNQLISTGTFAGWTVQQLLDEANRKLGGCSSSYSYSQLSDAVAKVNENFVDGNVTGSYITCCGNIVATCTSQPATCNGTSTGSVSVSATGGIAPYTYLWSNGATTASVSNLPAGSYSVTVRSANNCTATCTTAVTQPTAVTATCSKTDAGCNGTSTGSVSVTAAGGTAPYTYLWSNNSTAASQSGLAAGTYSVTVKDSRNCTATCSVTVGQPTTTPTATCSGTNVSCNGGNNGTAAVVASGGTTPYTYLWSNGATTASISGLAAATYSVVITDAHGCQALCSYCVTQPANPLTPTCSKVDGTCANNNLGSASVSITGGTTPYTYLWSNGATTSSISGLTAATYSVTVTDAKGCTATCSVIVTVEPCCMPTDPGQIGYDEERCGSFDPAEIVSIAPPTGGVGALEIVWISRTWNGTTWSSWSLISGATGLSYNPGTITVTTQYRRCSRRSGCPNYSQESNIITKTVNPGVTAQCNKTDVSCNGQSTGTASVTASGGTAPYTYLWSNNGTASSISGLAAGTYSVTVTDSKGCTGTCSVTVTQPQNPLSATCSKTDAGCSGTSTGSVSVVASGGTAPYTYLWNNGATTASQSGIPGGTYSVTVTDAKNCTATCSVTVGQPTTSPTATCSGTNVACNGGHTGSASVVASGGTAPYTYLWSNGATTASISGLAAATYSVVITDAHGCQALCSYCVTQPANPLTPTCTKVDGTCTNNNLGSASVSVTGGTAPYTYLWSNNSTATTISGLAAGTYSVTVTDAKGCTATCSSTVVITQCCNVTDGGTIGYDEEHCGPFDPNEIVSVTPATGGTGALYYYWLYNYVNVPNYGNNGWVTIPGATGASYNPGPITVTTYYVRCAKRHGCDIAVGESNIVAKIVNPIPTAQCSKTDVACYGQSTGSASVTASGGTAPYTYLWSNNGTGASITGLAAGTYSVTVTDSKSCTATCSVTVTQPEHALSATCNKTDAGCNGTSTGSVSVTASGGTAPYTYLWNNGSTAAGQSGIAAGTYSVTVTDAKNCTTTCSSTVGQPSTSPTATCSGSNVSCHGGNNGSAGVVASGGTAPYTYLWSNNATTASISGLAAATYTVLVTDAHGCTAICSYCVTQPDLLQATCEAGRVNCYGDATGSVTVLAQGGTAPYTYLWNNGATTASQNGIVAGPYSVTITDAHGCTATCSITVTQPQAPLTAQCTATNPGCFGASTGSVTVAPAGGTAPYTYLWNTGAITASVNGLPAATYTVVVTDAKGCTYTCSSTITQPAQLTATCSSQPAACFGSATGSATVTVQGGTAPFTYVWTNNSGTTSTISGLAAGTYTVTVTDSKGCTATCTATVDQASGLQATCSGTDVDCRGNATGSAAVVASGGTAPYAYLWSNGATTASLSGIVAGTYSVTVTDAHQCTATCTYTVTQPETLQASTEAGRVNCYGDATGSVVVLAQGGTSPYTYLWNNGATTASQNGIVAGTYSVTVTDAHGCTATSSIQVTQPQGPLTATCDSDDAACFGAQNGSASVVAGGGTAPYTYLWSNGALTASISGLAAGTYSVTVTDAKGCTATCSVVIDQASTLDATCSGTNVDCRGNATGSAAVVASGGTAPYAYLWSNGATTASLSGIVAGTYSVTVTDAHQCTATCTYIVTQPETLQASTEAGRVNCYGDATGSVVVLAQGGTLPYTYLWNNGETTAFVDSLVAGTYSVTVTDAQGCTATSSIQVTQPQGPLTATCDSDDAACYGALNGSASVVAGGGTAPYTYLWSNGALTASVNGLVAGTYSVTVTDSKGCTATCSVVVGQASTLEATCGGSAVNCYGDATGSANVSASGGTAPYTYLWNNGSINDSINGVVAGIYSVTVTDAHGCTATCSFEVTQPQDELSASTEAGMVSCYGDATGSVVVLAQGGTAPYSYLWSNGATTAFVDSIPAGLYSVTVTDAKGCTATSSITVTQPDHALSATCSSQPAACFGSPTGSVSVTASGGTAPYSYLWNTGATTASVSGLAAGTYSVTVTDSKNCSKSCTTDVAQADTLEAICSGTNASCFGTSTGSASVTASGGTAPYTYLWSTGATTSSINGLAAATYTVLVTDAHGCTAICTYCVTQPDQLLATCTGENVSCNAGNNGSAGVTVTGGTAPFTYLWSNGATTASISGLTAATYTVIVTDAHGCTAICSHCVTQPHEPLQAVCEAGRVLCYGESTGSAVTAAQGGTAPYTYLWNNGETTSSIDSLPAGQYSVTVTDAHGCTATCSIAVAQPQQGLRAECGSEPALCYGDQSGSANVNVYGGTAPYTYLWSNGVTSSTNSGVVAGTYSVTVTDANGCTDTCSVVVGQAGSLEATCSGTPADCYASSTGTADVSVSGGTAPYTYLWSNGSTDASVDSLAAGAYTVTVTDANECTATCTYEVSQPAPYYVVCNAVAAECYQAPTGSASVAVFGGTAPYTYAWDNGAITDSVSGLAPGTYTVVVTDAHGCQLTCSSTVDQAPMLEVNLEYGDASCGSSDACATAYPSGGTAPYTFFWSNETSGEETCNLAPGSYTVTVTDYYGCTVTREFHIDQANCPPIARNDFNNTIVNVPVSGDASTNDSDPDGDNLTFTQFTTPSNGTVVFNNDGSYTYTPNTDFVGDDNFDYYTCDDGTPSMCDTATVYITVIDNPKDPFNNPPVANADDFVTYVNTPVNGTVIANDFDPDAGDIITVTGIVTNPSNGTVTINPNGTFTYTPNAAYTGDDSFIYNLCDNGTPGPLCDTAVVVIHIKGSSDPDNNPPVAVDDAVVTEVNTPVNGNSSTNDYDIDGDNLTFTQFTNPSNGSVVFNNDGSFIYTPNNNYVGPDHFLYYVCDDGVPGPLCDTATVYITILTPGNNPPVARNDYNNTIVNVPVGGDASTNDSDPDGDNLTFTQLTTPSNGTVVFNNDGTYTYTPNTDYVGDDSFDYYICDDGTPSLCDTATVFITIIDNPKNPDNNPPVANADDFVTYVDVPVNGTVIPNDFDPDAGDVITVTGIVTNPSNGTVTINPNGTFTYTPNSGYTGEDSFIYNLCDNGTPGPLCDTALVVIHIKDNYNPDNNPPVAVDDAVVTDVNVPVSGDASLNDYDVDGDNLTFTQLTNPSNGSVVFNTDGSFTYTPNNNYVGPDHFVYYICDDGVPGPLCDTATVYITILTPGNNPPVARNDFNNTLIDTPVDGDASTNDYDPDGDNLTFTQLTTPSNGTVVFNPDGSYTYTPNSGFTGDDSFDYYICDDGNPSLCDTATVFITVIPPHNPNNNPPVANADDFITYVDIAVNGTVIPNDFDPDTADVISVTGIVTPPVNGTVTINPDGTFTYTPNTGYEGDDTFVYNLCDNGTPGPLCDTALVVIHVLPIPCCNPTNLPPVAVDDANITQIDTPVSGNLLTNDYDPNPGDIITINTAPVSGPSHGSVVINPDGSYTYTPNAGYTGPDNFVYFICDNGTPGPLCDTATCYITVWSQMSIALVPTPASCNGVCDGSINLTVTNGSAPFTYTWSNGATTEDISALCAGWYTVTVTDVYGTSLTDSAEVTQPAPVVVTVTPSGPTTFCEGDSVTLTASTAAAYVWTPNGETTQSIVVTAAGDYSVWVMDTSGCEGTSAPVTVTVNPNPTPVVSADGPTTFCSGDSVTLTSTTASVYVWSPTGETTQSIVVTASGDYSVWVMDANGCEGTSAPVTVTVTNAAPPTITPDGPTTLCEGECVNLTATYTGVNVTLLWSNGATTPTINVCASGTFTVSITDENGCTATSDPVSVIVNPPPVPTITPDGPTSFCLGNCITLTADTGYTDYIWSTGDTTQSITVCESGVFIVTVFDEHGCRGASAPLTVTVSEGLNPTVTADGPTTMCQGQCVTLTASAGVTYLWNNGATTQSITVCDNGSFSVTVTDVFGCSGTSVPVGVTVNPNPVPTVTPDGPTEFCQGQCVTLAAPSGYVSYLWSNGATTPSITVCATGDYSVTVTDANGCSGTSAPVHVEVGQGVAPVVTANGPTEICEGSTVTLTASSPNAVSYQWYRDGIAINGATGVSVTVGDFADYYVMVTDQFGCVGQSNLVLVKVGVIPNVYAGEDQTICPGDDVTLTATGATDYVWSNGETTPTITVSPAQATDYIVTGTNPFCGQTDSDTVHVSISSLPIAAAHASDDPSLGNPVNFTDISGDNSIVDWLWDFGDGNSAITQNAHHTYDTEGTFTIVLTVENEFGCSNYDTLQVSIEQIILIPNIITPNSDGLNDALAIKNNGVDNYGLTIFNRWGQIVFQREAREILWQGTTNSGVALEAGTYFYILKVQNDGSKGDFEKTGFMTLVR